MDLGSLYNISKTQNTTLTTGFSYYYSTNGTDWTWGILIGQTFDPTVSARYIKFVSLAPQGVPYMEVKEAQLWQKTPATGIHTSGDTQITDNSLYQRQTFTPTYTKPANTNITFKFRTSTDHITWTSWTASQTVGSGSPLDITSLVTSKTGDPGSETFYKYIQAETTLTSADGTSTPTLSDYTIGYHTNVKPNAPTAQSVTIGS